MSQTNKAASSTMWDKEATNLFCDLYLKEIELGNRLTTYFNKEGWQNLMIRFKELSGMDYDRKKLKNKWDQLKKNWKIWKDLKRGSTGLGWDPVRRTIDAPDDWWVQKIEVVPATKKIRYNGIDPALEEKLNDMFTEVVATGAYAFTQNEERFSGLPEEIGTVQIDDSREVLSPVHTDVQSTSEAKRPRVDKNKKGMAFIKDKIDSLIETCKSKSVPSTENSIEECLQLFDAYPDVTAET